MSTDPNRVADRFELRSLAENYARGADRRDGDLVADQFVSDGRILIFDHGELSPEPTRRIEGREQIAAAMQKLKRYEVTTHFVGQHTVTFTGEVSANGETYCLAHHISGEGEERNNYIMSIRYHDNYRRENDRWYIVERRLMCDWTERRVIGPRIFD